jgi:transcriptional regulator with XRE-family HTH domain
MARNTIETFPDRLRELREGKGMSRDQLAVAAETSSHSLELAWRVAKALGCSLDELVQSPAAHFDAKPGRPPKTSAVPAPKPRDRPKKASN